MMYHCIWHIPSCIEGHFLGIRRSWTTLRRGNVILLSLQTFFFKFLSRFTLLTFLIFIWTFFTSMMHPSPSDASPSTRARVYYASDVSFPKSRRSLARSAVRRRTPASCAGSSDARPRRNADFVKYLTTGYALLLERGSTDKREQDRPP